MADENRINFVIKLIVEELLNTQELLNKELSITENTNTEAECFFNNLKRFFNNLKKLIETEVKAEKVELIVKEAINKKGETINPLDGNNKDDGKSFYSTVEELGEILDSLDNKLSSGNLLPKNFLDALISLFFKRICDKTNLESNLLELDKKHQEWEEEKIERVKDRNKEIRNAEKFLASDEFARFAADPYFNISKDKKRKIKLNDDDDDGWELFDVTVQEQQLIDMGHEFAVFRGHLKDRWLNSTTYKIESKDKSISYYLRLSKLGLLQIRKEIKLEGKKNLRAVLVELLESQGRKDAQADDILQVAVGFAELLEFRTTSNYQSHFGKGKKISPLTRIEAKEKYSEIERQRYTLILFNKLEGENGSKEGLSPSDIHKNNPEVISCILQGTLEVVENRNLASDSSNYHIHKIPEREGQNIKDLSTWKNELCVFSPERGFIFFNHKKTFEDGGRLIDYEDYWKCLVRGVEYTVALRASLQILESKTTKLLESIPEILEQFNRDSDGNLEDLNKKREELLKNFAEDLANILKILPPMRSIAIPTNAFRSGHSVDKFSYLSEDCFRFSETLSNIQQNIDELTNFLTFFKQQQLEISFNKEAQRESSEDRKLSKIAVIFTIASILYVFASFAQDFSSFFDFSGHLDANKSDFTKIILVKSILGKLLIIGIYSLLFTAVWTVIKMIREEYKFKKGFWGIIGDVIRKMFADANVLFLFYTIIYTTLIFISLL